jgi:hypothetical protein
MEYTVLRLLIGYKKKTCFKEKGEIKGKRINIMIRRTDRHRGWRETWDMKCNSRRVPAKFDVTEFPQNQYKQNHVYSPRCDVGHRLLGPETNITLRVNRRANRTLRVNRRANITLRVNRRANRTLRVNRRANITLRVNRRANITLRVNTGRQFL